MEDLVEVLEDSLHLLKQKNKTSDAQCYNIGKLLKPWKLSVATTDENPPTEKPSEEDQQDSIVDKEICEIDNLLKKAKLVRTLQSAKSNTTLKKKAKKLPLATDSKSEPKLPCTSNSTKSQLPVKKPGQNKEENLSNRETNNAVKSHICLKEVLENEEIPKDLRKYDALYDSLKHNKVFACNKLFAVTSEAESSFIESLKESASIADENPVLTQTFAVRTAHELSDLCLRLSCLLNSEHDRFINSRRTPAQHYRYKLVVEGVLAKVEDIQAAFRNILNCSVFPNEKHLDSFLDNPIKMSSLYPSQQIMFKNRTEAVSFFRDFNQLKSLRFVYELKRSSAAPLIDALKKIPEVLEFEESGQINLRFIQAYKNTFALLSQENSSIHPAIIWNP